jgi:hypothetical protein
LLSDVQPRRGGEDADHWQEEISLAGVLSLIGRRQLLQTLAFGWTAHYSRLLKKTGSTGRAAWTLAAVKAAAGSPKAGAGWATTGAAPGGVGTASGASSATSRLFEAAEANAAPSNPIRHDHV